MKSEVPKPYPKLSRQQQLLDAEDKNHRQRKLNSKDIAFITRTRIESLIQGIKSPTRVGVLFPRDDEQVLMYLERKRVAYLYDQGDDFIVGQANPRTFLRVVEEVLLNEYGMDLKTHIPSSRMTGPRGDGYGVESLMFPSRTIPGLAFTRVIITEPEDPKTIHEFYWYANDIAPFIRIKGKDYMRSLPAINLARSSRNTKGK